MTIWRVIYPVGDVGLTEFREFTNELEALKFFKQRRAAERHKHATTWLTVRLTRAEISKEIAHDPPADSPRLPT